ncbi:hypothetical protein TWF102_002024 [Orbilia oligospora]|uniref:Uncharacterized protein n=1 Tax=Orbilia oligospora TaxID=2813651 RepID=A0A7C8P2X8_ORBOL|nr:hypothetical protein TWF102_002024 [Orbilia oligospora]KAF3080984.1 hypothetical protein TWF102_002024 [Orbilia oligospora]KAF3090072.1 hypothetical protein TWF706_010221 [Orbilia oligospora]KAF3090073.1 hypothetical protein TWF706_010221 [Orbilia oligospora]KAF3117924.1 hypothetical protein TWF103_004583 [Orbilia oligospora]
MPPITPRQLKSCLSSSSSPSDFSSPADSFLANTPAITATPPTPYSSGGSPYYTTPTPAARRQKKSVRFHPEAEVKEFRQVREIKEVRTRTSSSGSTSTSTKRKFREEVKVEEKVVDQFEKRVSRKVERKEEVVEVRKGKKRKESQDESYYYESTSNDIMKSGITGLGITVDGSYGPPTKAPPKAPLPPRPTKHERTKYSQSPIVKSDEPKLTCSFDDSTSTSSYPNMSFGQAPPACVPTEESSFTELASYPQVPRIMSTGYSFTEQPEQAAWWAYQEPELQPPVVAAAASRPLRRKRSFEPKRQSCEGVPPTSPEIVDVESMRSRRGSTIKTNYSSSSTIPSEYAYKEAKVEKPSRVSSRRRREEENWEEQYRMESLKRQARQKTRDREVKKHSRSDRFGSFNRDAGSGYFNNTVPNYSFDAGDSNEGYF